MSNAIIFGSTSTGMEIYKDIKDEVNVVAFVDEDSNRWGESINGILVRKPEDILHMDYDYIYIGVLTYYKEVVELLHGMGIPFEKVIGRYVEIPTYARIECLKSIRDILDEDGIEEGAVAELGVYQGDFAREINKVFPEKEFYLFDTFEGFDSKDCGIEMDKGYSQNDKTGYFSNTTEKLVMDKMLYPKGCHIIKGYFPESINGGVSLETKFCFVNLDADLYTPTLEGLKYFYPRLVKGGIILVHDYFSKAFTGAKDAVREYCNENGIKYVPIGDTLSVAIRK
jgi:O-methyltransferase